MGSGKIDSHKQVFPVTWILLTMLVSLGPLFNRVCTMSLRVTLPFLVLCMWAAFDIHVRVPSRSSLHYRLSTEDGGDILVITYYVI